MPAYRQTTLFRQIGLFGLILLLFGAGLTKAQTPPSRTYQVNKTFSTQNQSVWAPGLPARYDFNYDMIKSWNNSASGGGFYDTDLFGEFGAYGYGSTDGRIGLKFRAYATAGDVNVNYPLTIRIDYPEWAVRGTQAVVHTSFTGQPNAYFATTSPSAGAALDFVFRANARAGLQLRAFSEDIINEDPLFDISIPDTTFTLFNTDDYLFGGPLFSWSGPQNSNIIQADLSIPYIATTGGYGSQANILTSTGLSDMIKLRGSLTNLIVYILQRAGIPVPNFQDSWEWNEAGFDFSFAYEFLQIWLGMNIGLQQDFKFTPRPMITLTTNTGQTVTVQAGQNVLLNMPTDGSSLQITPSIAFQNTFRSQLSLALTGSINFDFLKISGSGETPLFDLGSFDFQPLPTYSYAKTLPIPILINGQVASQNAPDFALAGFQGTQSSTPFSIRENSNVQVPVITSVSPAFCNDRNKVDFYDQEPQSLVVTASSGTAPFPTGSQFYLDYGTATPRLLDVNLINGRRQAELNLPVYILTPGRHVISVLSNGIASSVNFTVNHFTPVLQTQIRDFHADESANPISWLPYGSPAQTLYVIGGGLAPTSRVFWNGQPLETRYQASSTDKLIFDVPASLLASGGVNQVQVVNPDPVNGTPGSNVLTLSVSNPTPALTSVSVPVGSRANPAQASTTLVDLEGFSLDLMGSGFVPGSQIQYRRPSDSDWLSLTTEYVRATQLRTPLPTSLLTTGGTWNFRVVNTVVTIPGQGNTGGASAEQSLTVMYPQPQISELSPSYPALGGPAFTLSVRGTAFYSGAKVQINNVPLSTTFVSSTELRASVPASLLNQVTNLAVTVLNPNPSLALSPVFQLPVRGRAIRGRVTSNGAGVSGATVTVASGDPTQRTWGPQNYGNGGTTRSSVVLPLNVPVSGFIRGIQVGVNIGGISRSTLRVILIHPDGTNTVLHNRTGSGIGLNVTYPSTQPAQSLTILNGKPTAGTWKLVVEENSFIEIGTINNWSLQLAYDTATTRSVNTNASGDYAFTDLPQNTYTVRAAAAGLTFVPDARTVTLGNDQENINFATLNSISGRVVLQEAATNAVPLTFTFRPVAGGTGGIRAVTPAADGTFTMGGLPADNYLLHIKGAKWLAMNVPADLRSGSLGNVNVLLRGGDANNDNAADALDLATLISAFNTVPGDPFWDEAADFNLDGSADALDLAILITNFNQEGDQ